MIRSFASMSSFCSVQILPMSLGWRTCGTLPHRWVFSFRSALWGSKWTDITDIDQWTEYSSAAIKSTSTKQACCIWDSSRVSITDEVLWHRNNKSNNNDNHSSSSKWSGRSGMNFNRNYYEQPIEREIQQVCTFCTHVHLVYSEHGSYYEWIEIGCGAIGVRARIWSS